MNSSKRVLIVGASDKPDRYAHKALVALRHHGHGVVLVHPRLKEIDGLPVHADISDVTEPVDTVTMYVSPAISSGLAEKFIALKPQRVIFNPGSENPELESQLAAAGIHPEEACTLVLLATGQF
ncbi:hypothetical protein SAMN02745166_00959 [Prosthecobacter debontii]|uniref:CoA-binding domain-containing protein n=1 Tax=Prosthecobacter debontii TaxID=48467 RepID=A0A1T4WZL7_9BACT|nr:CoA-binding protein [Prosthecobacter debontii]SKA82754.1 hypothetical protein SAMN02745166_00959 [Prosthecobacter debontii]